MSRSKQRAAPFLPAISVVLTVAAFISLFACSRTPPPDLPPQIATLLQEQKWEEAIPIINHHLLTRPRDIAAHFYRGQCYANLKDPPLAVAEGEFQIALALFRQDAATAPVADMTPKDFELRCCLEIANVYMRSLEAATRLNANPSVLDLLVRNVDSATANAARIAPEDPRVKRLQDFLNNVTQHGRPAPPATTQTRISIYRQARDLLAVMT